MTVGRTTPQSLRLYAHSDPPKLESPPLTEARMTTSSQGPRMAMFVLIRWRRIPSTTCLRGAPCPYETSPYRPTDNGQLWQASKWHHSRSWRKPPLIDYSDIAVKLVDTRDMTNVLLLRDQPNPTKHISFHPSGSYIALSCTDGIIYIYSLTTAKSQLVRKVDGIIRSLETDADASSQAIWHPDGRAFAAPTAARDIEVISRTDGEKQRRFSGGHDGDLTALAWSPNGALLVTAGADKKIVVWETKSQSILSR